MASTTVYFHYKISSQKIFSNRCSLDLCSVYITFVIFLIERKYQEEFYHYFEFQWALKCCQEIGPCFEFTIDQMLLSHQFATRKWKCVLLITDLINLTQAIYVSYIFLLLKSEKRRMFANNDLGEWRFYAYLVAQRTLLWT